MKKRCNRRHWALVNPIAHVLDGLAVTPGYKLDQLHIRELSAIEAMTHGHGNLQCWSDLTSVLNLCQGMALKGVGPEALPYCETLQAELIAAAHRYDATKRMGLTATGLQAAREVIEYHDLQRRSISLQDYERHIADVTNRIKSRSPEVEEV